MQPTQQKSVSASEIKSYKKCPRRHYYEYSLRRVPSEQPNELLLGSMVHAGLEQIWLSKPWREHVYQCARGLGVTRDSVDLCGTALAMCSHYEATYISDIESSWDVVAAEQEFRVDIGFPCHGVFDTVARHRESGKLYVIEHKTAGRVDDLYINKTMYDTQASMYRAAAKSMYGEHVTVMWDVIIKPYIAKDAPSSVEDMYGYVLNKYSRAKYPMLRRFVVPSILTVPHDPIKDLKFYWHMINNDKMHPQNENSCYNCPYAGVCAGRISINDASFTDKKRKEVASV